MTEPHQPRERPILGVSGAEAARILDMGELSVDRRVRQGVLHKPVKRQQYALDHTEVEAYALQRWKPGHPYWRSSHEAAEILGLTSSRVSQLARAGKIPAVRHRRRWFFRRHQVDVVANAREARLLKR